MVGITPRLSSLYPYYNWKFPVQNVSSGRFSAPKTRLRRFSCISKEHLKVRFILLPEIMPVSLCTRKKTSLGSKTFEKPSIHFRFIVETTLYTPCFSGIRSMLLNGFCPVYRQRFLCLIQARIGNPFLDCPSSFGGDIEHQKVGHFGQCPLFLPQTFESLMRITGTFFRFSHFELSGYNGNNGHVFTKKPEFAFRVLKAISGMKFYFFKKFFLGF